MKRKKWHHSNDTSTQRSLKYFSKKKDSLGKIKGVKLSPPHTDKRARDGKTWYRVHLYGTEMNLTLKGLAWGYCGEGSRGLVSVLTDLGFGLKLKDIAELNSDTAYHISKI